MKWWYGQSHSASACHAMSTVAYTRIGVLDEHLEDGGVHCVIMGHSTHREIDCNVAWPSCQECLDLCVALRRGVLTAALTLIRPGPMESGGQS
jgi:hypothetical protein